MIIVAGGAEIYAQALPLARRLHITYVHRTVDGDAYFPAIDRGQWHEVAHEEHAAAAGDDAAFTFVTYRARRVVTRVVTDGTLPYNPRESQAGRRRRQERFDAVE